jgi:hypothetical protein
MPVRVKISRAKTASEKDGLGYFDTLQKEMTEQFNALKAEVQ